MAKRKSSALEIPIGNYGNSRVVSSNGEHNGDVSKDKSIYVYQREKINRPVTIRELPWTEKQKQFIDLVLDKQVKVLLVKGPAGTSKTLTSMYAALKLLNAHRVSDIILVRSAVESSDSKLGFLPGDTEDKMSEYLVPFTDKLDELLSDGDQKFLIHDHRVQAIPVGFMRGRHLAVRCVILDEAQNCTFSELTTIITRMGLFSKLIMLGDPSQSDLPNGKKIGFPKFWDLFNDEPSKEKGIHTFEFIEDDILRSELVRYVVHKIATMAQLS